MSKPEYILIIANSGRMLAQAAFDAGFKPLVIDLFADLDTQSHADDFVQVASLALHDLASATEHFISRYAVKHFIYGSGFEKHPESLVYLAERLLTLGNSVDSFVNVQDKQHFFSALKQLDIPSPAVSFTAPAFNKNSWLVKPLQGQGGLGIRRYCDDESSEPIYWQRLITGSPHSLLFLANGVNAQIVGFNTQWVDETHYPEHFIFSRVINKTDLSKEHKQTIAKWLEKLVPLFSLKGLNSLDFIQTPDQQFFVLEINPRPSASMQLYDSDLLIRHIDSCRGELSPLPPQKHYTAYQIVYAPYDITIPEAFNWPQECVDLSNVGVTCRKGQPICSIIAHHEQADLLMDTLKIKQYNLLKGLNSYGIPSKC